LKLVRIELGITNGFNIEIGLDWELVWNLDLKLQMDLDMELG